MKMKIKIIILAALSIFLSSEASAFSLSMDAEDVVLQFGKNAFITGSIMNESDRTECLDVSAETNDERIGARIDVAWVCLNAGESRDFELDVTNYGSAEEGTYFTEVAIKGDTGFFKKTFGVIVRKNGNLLETDPK
jgi:uncharacterized membrane protein